MPFEKGNNANPKGRPKGAQNKSISELRAVLQSALDGEISNLPVMLAELETEKRLEMIAKFIGFVLPKPIEQTNNGDAQPITITRTIIHKSEE